MTKGPPRDVRIDECEREELRLAKQRKRMAVLRNADHPRRSARLQAEQLRLQQLTLTALFTLLLHMANCQHATPTKCNVTCRFKGKMRARARGIHCEYIHLVSPRNSTSFTRPFLAGRRARAGHETSFDHSKM